ncbi:MAG: hypothetical protein Kow00114_20150 [Kiloniellaceae bacterium]
MKHSPLFSAETAVGRRRFAGFAVSAALVAVALAACADLRSAPRDPNHKPFWEREEQRD